MRTGRLIQIYGNVQGVSFRLTAQSRARALGIVGFARNEPDGSLFIRAEGGVEKVDQFVSWCRSGPPAASVKRVEETVAETEHFTDFTIC